MSMTRFIRPSALFFMAFIWWCDLWHHWRSQIRVCQYHLCINQISSISLCSQSIAYSIISQIFFKFGSISSNLNLNTTSMICLQEILKLTIADNFQNVELKTKKLHIVLESTIHWRTSSNTEVLTDKYTQLINLSYLTYNSILTIRRSCLNATVPILSHW